MKFFLFYLLAIGVLGVIFLCTDKYKATHDRWRIKERTLHLLEFFGGIFLMLPTMYIIRHKCSKVAFYWKSWAILALWIAGICYYFIKY